MLVNEKIVSIYIKILDENGSFTTKDPIHISEAKALARAQGLDLIEITASTPERPYGICKVGDEDKIVWSAKKRQKQVKQHKRVTKEIRLRPAIGLNDLKIKGNQIKRILQDGDSVVVSLKFRGREASHADFSSKVIEHLLTYIGKQDLIPQIKTSTDSLSLRIDS